MSIVTIMPSGKTVEAGEGMTILAAILQADPDFPHKCEGNAKCGSCHIYVLEGRKGVTKTTRDENGKLDELVGVGSKSRLACQVKVLGTEDIKIEIPAL
ncbi:2Fe-2S iron-sulfur cluster-binding protein [Rhodoblastus sp.]|uniref:2Fe-2S iron-sulfur cluster-binding protein n=1 Tax=Rhodoblastus sp. TaxID=1962975 RepID=UPI003F96B134